MRNLVLRLLGGTLGLLAGCQSAADKATSAPAAVPPATLPAASAVPAGPVSASVSPAVPYTGYHRYRGTVGGQPVTVELTIDSTETYPRKKLACTGSYYYGQGRAGLLTLAAASPYQPRQPLRLQETAGNRATGTWQATQPAGPLLAGIWRSPAGKQLPFSLRKDYTDGQGRLMAVRYEMLTTATQGRVCQEEDPALKQPATLTRQYLHLLGPDTLRPTLRALQCPVPRRRRALQRAFVRGDGACQDTDEYTSILLNDYGLLSLATGTVALNHNVGRYEHAVASCTYDLRTGRELTPDALLRPGTDTLLQQLIGQHLMRDTAQYGGVGIKPGQYGPGNWPYLPEALGLKFVGLLCDYGDGSVGGPGVTTVTVPWRELLPLLRPDSPVARMLRERGLWQPDRKKSRPASAF